MSWPALGVPIETETSTLIVAGYSVPKHNEIKCPVCGISIKEDCHYEEAWGSPIETESCAFCPAGHWSSEYLTGSTRETVKGREWIWSYHETPEEQFNREKEIADAIETAKATGQGPTV